MTGYTPWLDDGDVRLTLREHLEGIEHLSGRKNAVSTFHYEIHRHVLAALSILDAAGRLEDGDLSSNDFDERDHGWSHSDRVIPDPEVAS